MKILLLEDNADTQTYIAHALRDAGHVVDVCANGRDAVFLGSSGEYTAMIIDRMTPGIDGLGVLKALRVSGVATPALFLTAVDGVEDRVEGLEAGADDYMVKPFALSELMARLNALARRPPIAAAAPVRLQVGDLELDLLKRTVVRGARRIELQPQEFKILEYLMRHAGQVVTRGMLLENVWSFHFDPQTNIVESHISRLRAKIDRDHEGEALIHTVRGAGYRIDDAA